MTSHTVRVAGRVLPGLMLLVGLFCLAAGPALAQQRPLVTQDPESVGAGHVLVEAGFDYGIDLFFPASGLHGNLLRLPMLGLVVGVSDIAEIQLTGGPYQRLSVGSRSLAPLADQVVMNGDRTTDVVDMVIGAKVRLLSESSSRPAVAFAFATKLPNSKHPNGIGLNTIDFYTSLSFGKTIQSIRFVGNLGLGILPDPVAGRSQNDVLTYGGSIARAVTDKIDVVGELNGRASLRSGEAPIGTESRSMIRAGARYTYGAARVDAGLLLGLTTRDPSFGFTAGVTYMFKAFTPKG
ncbi:MAG TPA: transporter [Vicinamibacterales bacterium]